MLLPWKRLYGDSAVEAGLTGSWLSEVVWELLVRTMEG